MLIISNKKDEGVFNLDNITHIRVKKLEEDGSTMYSLMFSNLDGRPGFIGGWELRVNAEHALDDIVKANHCGNKEVYLDD